MGQLTITNTEKEDLGIHIKALPRITQHEAKVIITNLVARHIWRSSAIYFWVWILFWRIFAKSFSSYDKVQDSICCD